MIDHVVIRATSASFEKTVELYEKALAPIGYKKLHEIPSTAAGFGEEAPEFWVFAAPEAAPSHVALRAKGQSFLGPEWEQDAEEQ
jgi:hypothetical protein